MTATTGTGGGGRDLADRLAAQDVIVRYASGIDERDFDAYRECFTPDAEFHDFAGEVIRGPDAWIEFVRRVLAPFRATQHLLGTSQVELRGSEAALRAPLQAQHFHREPEGRIFTVWGTYRSSLVRDGDLWRIRHHRLDVQATRTHDEYRS